MFQTISQIRICNLAIKTNTQSSPPSNYLFVLESFRRHLVISLISLGFCADLLDGELNIYITIHHISISYDPFRMAFLMEKIIVQQKQTQIKKILTEMELEMLVKILIMMVLQMPRTTVHQQQIPISWIQTIMVLEMPVRQR